MVTDKPDGDGVALAGVTGVVVMTSIAAPIVDDVGVANPPAALPASRALPDVAGA
jgi:hypothetical protein